MASTLVILSTGIDCDFDNLIVGHLVLHNVNYDDPTDLHTRSPKRVELRAVSSYHAEGAASQGSALAQESWPAHEQMARLVGVSENTLRDYFLLYQEGGLDKLKEVHLYRPTSELDTHITSLEEYFRKHPPATIKEAQHQIEQLTGIKRSETQAREFLKKAQLSVSRIGCAECSDP